MTTEMYNDIMQRLDVIGQKLEVAGTVIFQQAMVWNYAFAWADITLIVMLCAVCIIAWTRKLTEENSWVDYSGGMPTSRAIIVWTLRLLFSLIAPIVLVAELPNIIMRFSCPILGALQLIGSVLN